MGNSKSICYEDYDEGIKSQILSEFIKIYSDKKITGIPYYYNDTYDIKKNGEIYILLETDKYKSLVFRNKFELIKFVEKLDRSFIIMGEFSSDYNVIYFVYGS
jgi:hypothetical protein